ncbi:MAG: hypothetical protein ACYCY0_04520 [Acidithiobacillus ferrivorans]
MDDDILNHLEAVVNDGGNDDGNAHQPLGGTHGIHHEHHTPAPEPGRDRDSQGMHSALAAIPDPMTRERVLRIALDHQVDKRDPAWLLVETAVVSVTAAAEAGAAARLVHENVAEIPATIQKAVVAGGEDVAGQVRTALTSNLGEFAEAIGQGVHLATNKAVTNVQTALKNFDAKVDKTIIARKDAVIAQWVQLGSDALDQRVREAIKTERTINLVFMLFVIFSTFILGIVLGTQLHLHF